MVFIVDNSDVLVNWEVFIFIGEGIYEIWFVDDDGGLDGLDDLCGVIFFSQMEDGII